LILVKLGNSSTPMDIPMSTVSPVIIDVGLSFIKDVNPIFIAVCNPK
jgi:hypothetical protein